MSTYTYGDVRSFLSQQFPSAELGEIDRAATAVLLLLKVGQATKPAAKPTTRKPRRHTEKSVAESLKLKR